MVQILSTVTLILATATSITAQRAGEDDYPASVDASSYVSEIYAPSPIPTQIPASKVTKLASELYSLEKSFVSNKANPSVHDAVASAITHAPNPTEVAASIDASGYAYHAITTNEWYQDHVDKKAKKIISEYNSKWDSIVASVLEVSTNAAPAPVCTGAVQVAVAAGAAMGVMAMM
ncbi:hypothetical protein QBC38DRAFT_487695 [Podospora fimiseda]|uniref:Uncharacterized protein n=1 Tax=Podospora fimiseda TaxID=252190 RepID=A0AAN7BHC7_9PEZI|nr:hypothetical protein QBC38DRAFT_487695 [Podospora fimiseda]